MLAFILLGLIVGVLSGLVGIGGGVFIVPALVYIWGMSQYQAQGTTLALLVPPIGILGAWAYYKQGYVDLKVASLICIGFVFGSLLGAKIAIGLSKVALKRVFGGFLLVIGCKMIFETLKK